MPEDTDLHLIYGSKPTASAVDADLGSIYGTSADAIDADLGSIYGQQPRRPQASRLHDLVSGQVARGIPKPLVLAVPPAQSEKWADDSSRGLRASGVAGRVVDKLDAEAPPTHRGATSAFQRFGDKVDFAVSVPLVATAVSRSAAPVLAISRPMFATMNWMGQKNALSRMTPEERQAFVDGLDAADYGRKGFQNIVDVMNRFEQENPGASRRDMKNDLEVTAAGTDLLKELFLWSSKSGKGERDPYGGNYPVAFNTGTAADGSTRAADATDMILRGAFDMTDDEVNAWRPRLQSVSAWLGRYPREAMFGTISMWKGLTDDEATIGGTMAALQDGYAASVAAGDTGAGMGFLNMMAMIGPDVMLPSGKALELVDTSAGMLSRQGEAARQLEKGRHLAQVLGVEGGELGLAAGKVTDDVSAAAAKLGRELNGAEVSDLAHQVSAAVDNIFRNVATNATDAVTHIDTTGALSLAMRDDALRVVTDLDAVVATGPRTIKPPKGASFGTVLKQNLKDEIGSVKVPLLPDRFRVPDPRWWAKEVVPEFFPKRSPLSRALRWGGAKVVGKINADSAMGYVLLKGTTAAEKGRKVFGKGEPLLVVDPNNGKLRLPEPTDTLGEHSWTLVRAIMGPNRRSTQNEIMAEVNDAIRAVMDGTSGPVEADLVRKFAEVLGSPNADAADAGRLWRMLEEKINKGLEATPAILEDLSRATTRTEKAAGFAAKALEKADARLAAAQTRSAAADATRARFDELKRSVSEADAALGAAKKRAEATADAVANAGRSKKEAAALIAAAEADERTAQAALKAAEDALAALQGRKGGVDPAKVAAASKARDAAIRRVADAANKVRSAKKFNADSDYLAAARKAKTKAAREAGAAEVRLNELQRELKEAGSEAAASSSELAAAQAARAEALKGVEAAANRRKQAALAAQGAGDMKAAKAAKAKAKADVVAAKAALATAKRELRKAPKGADAIRMRAQVDAAEAALRAAEARVTTTADRLKYLSESFASASAGVKSVPPASLQDKILKAVEMQAARANLVGDIMETMTGTRSAKAAKARAELGRELRVLGDQAKVMASDARLKNALQDMTLADAKQAERALERILKGGPSADAYASLSPAAKDAVVALRAFFDGMYDRLKAAGRMGGFSKEAFFERVLTEGYVPHMLSKGGRKLMRQRLAGRGGKASIGTKMDALLKRKIAGEVDEINQTLRERIAEMIWEAELEKTGDLGEAAEDAISRIIREQGLDKDVYFETNPAELMMRYGQDTARGLANTRMIQDLTRLFPEGDRFAAAAKGQVPGSGSMKAADTAAAEAGFVRVKRATLLRTLDPELASWAGWSKHSEDIGKLLDGYAPESADRLFNRLRELGAPIDEIVSAETRPELRNWVYLPKKVAAELDELASPGMWNWMDTTELGKAPREYLAAFTSVLKAALTVMAVPFHTRNWMSNNLSSWMTNGWDAVAPSTQIKSFSVLNAADDALIDIGAATMTAKQWRRLFRQHGIITDITGYTGEGASTMAGKVRIAQGVKAYALGAAVGAVGGAVAGGEDYRVAGAFGGAFLLSGVGGITSANIDVFGRPAMKAAREHRALGGTARGMLRKGFETVYGDLLQTASKAHKAGSIAGLIGAIWGAGTGVGPEVSAAAYAAGTAFVAVAEAGMTLGGGVGRNIEDMAKIGNAIAEMKKGGSLDAAARAAVNATFDYGDLTKIEREVFHKAFLFYTWESKNIALQADLMVNHPKRYNLVMKTMRAAASDEDAWALPEYAGFRWVVGTGVGRFIAGLSTPQEAAVGTGLKDWRGFASGLNPLAKAILERSLDESFFYGKAISKIASGRDYKHMNWFFRDSVGYAEDITDSKGRVWSGPQIGWYRQDETTPEDRLNGLDVGVGADGLRYVRDIDRGTRVHQIYMSHPTRRLMTEFNKAIADSYRFGVDAEDPTQRATFMERVSATTTGFRVTQHDPTTVNQHSWWRMVRHTEELVHQGLAYGMVVEPQLPSAPGGYLGPTTGQPSQ